MVAKPLLCPRRKPSSMCQLVALHMEGDDEGLLCKRGDVNAIRVVTFLAENTFLY